MKSQNIKIETDETLREVAGHGNEEYPFAYYLEDIWLFDFHCVDWHWHSEVEFVYVKKGEAVLLIGSERYQLTEGNGIFINSKVIHRFEATDTVIFPNIVFAPQLLAPVGSLIYNKYIHPLLHSNVSHQILRKEVEWQKDILVLLQDVFALQESEEENEMQNVSLLLKIWDILWKHTGTEGMVPDNKQNSQNLARMHIMMQYIHENFSKHITLDDIAKEVALSKSSMLNLFHQYLKTTPINYLIHYRLRIAAQLLISTQNSITLIAQETGFDSIDYFCRKFKKRYGVTPGEYRRKEK